MKTPKCIEIISKLADILQDVDIEKLSVRLYEEADNEDKEMYKTVISVEREIC